MNVIITNKNESVLMSLGIDVIKTLNGVFTVDDLAATFKNFYYNKMILDITAIEDYENIYRAAIGEVIGTTVGGN